MGRRIEKGEDEWHGVLDPKKRKQIQDRLAQRARRQRLAEGGNNRASKRGVGTGGKRSEKKRYAPEERQETEEASLSYSSPDLPQSISPSTSLISMSSPSSDHKWSSLPQSVYSALFQNGIILSLPCSASIISKSAPATSSTPPSLVPTALQLNTVHFQWIDRFPLPKTRNRMIMYSDYFNSEDFVGDLYTKPSFTIREGGESWREEDWGVVKEFRDKWWYLFA